MLNTHEQITINKHNIIQKHIAWERNDNESWKIWKCHLLFVNKLKRAKSESKIKATRVNTVDHGIVSTSSDKFL